MPIAADPTNPLLHDRELMDRLERIWDDDQKAKEHRRRRRRKRGLARLWDGDMNYRGRVTAELSGSVRWVMNNTGTATLQLPVDHYLTKWAVNPWGRTKQNVHFTFDKDGARWGGRCAGDSAVKIVKTDDGKRYVELTFLDDYEDIKSVLVWSNPFLPAILQFPRSFVLAGPSRYMLKLALFLNVMRLEGNWWALPDDPLDPQQWLAGLDMSQWNIVVKPHKFLEDSSPWTILSSRFKYWHDMAAPTLDDAQLMVTTRRYLPGDPPPWPGANLRYGTIVVDIVDKSGYWDETSTGGTIWDGLKRTVVEFADNFIDEIVNTVAEPIDPYRNIVGRWLGTYPRQPYAVYRDGKITGVEASEWSFTPAGPVQMVGGGHSAYGINEGISAGIQTAGNIAGGFVYFPTAGTIADTFLAPIYTDTVAAFWSIKSPVRTLRSGWSHSHERWVEGMDRAYTLSSLIKMREGFFNTRPRHTHKLTLGDGRPYFIGDNGQGHWFLGDRIGSTIRDFPIRGQVFVEQVSEVEYSWDREHAEWKGTVGDPRANEPTGEKNMRLIRTAVAAVHNLGLI
ncbi:phage tail protein [Rhodococcus rhodnii]|uniref:Gp28/Gp37-like domain-containing protein n=2 Tax=Rhodococcus rhodnii TaxID=38312 RepID=R7WRF0_9NOCA|nr:hypothetical protein [Rhodococcus rhodnii]EOM77898.1 hypothetical protein Rrhod_0707 [Rhodococcus rhodnii LMG 5362]TXG90317.1 phage tail protein [Rhodococcus rhodnii]